MSQPGMISHGLPPRDNDVQRAIADLQRQVNQMSGSLVAATNNATATANSTSSAGVAPGYVSLPASDFAVATAGANLISANVSVPAGYTRCVISLVGRVFATNPGAATDYLYARIGINGANSTAVPLPVAAGSAGLNVATAATVLTGLSTSVAVNLWASSATAGWAASTSNYADLAGSIVWMK